MTRGDPVEAALRDLESWVCRTCDLVLRLAAVAERARLEPPSTCRAARLERLEAVIFLGQHELTSLCGDRECVSETHHDLPGAAAER